MSKRRRKDSLSLRKAKAEHEKFLKSVGADKASRSRNIRYTSPSLKVEQSCPPTSNTIGSTAPKKARPGEDAGERPETLAEIAAKSKRVAPLYNKGGTQYITERTRMQDLGRK